jgi:uncharacterized protein (TIGR02271 family)
MDTQDRNRDAALGGSTAGGSNLGRLSEMDDYQVADGYPDIRGWEVKSSDGRTVGEVKDLIADTAAMRVRYLDVEVDRTVGELAQDAATPGDQERHVLLPIGVVRLDDARDDVLVDGYTAAQIAGLPRYTGGAVSSDYERSLHARRYDTGAGMADAGTAAGSAVGAGLTGAPVMSPLREDRVDYDHPDFDDQRAFASRRRDRAHTSDREDRLTLSEEQLSVGKQTVQAGEVGVRKTVETEHVRESVPVTHDEVTIERHPVSASDARDLRIGEDEVRVPVMREEVVAEKRVVPREEVIVRKQAVTENREVGADLRRERLVTEGMTERTTGSMGASTSGAADRATDSGPLDRLADKADDLKDRVDGNPASRPGPDATDRRI